MKIKKTLLLLFLFIPAIIILCDNINEAEQDTIVHVTHTGRSYHLDSCRHLRQSRVAISLSDAFGSGYSPCSTCGPPVLENSPGRTSRNDTELYRVNIAGVRTSCEADFERMLKADVVGHVDGDTVRVRITNPPAGLNVIETIRLLGVDTPETVHPNRHVEHFGQEASDFTKAALLDQTVYLAFDWDLRDRFGRLLAYIYTDEGRSFNARLIYEGFGHALLRYPFQFMDEFRDLEQEARREGRGLWGF